MVVVIATTATASNVHAVCATTVCVGMKREDLRRCFHLWIIILKEGRR
jgi:hypothetical protein